ncbi:ATP-binding protein [Streptomyces sp. YIM 98790]|uniref:ATP-binding protein n=1 Tax=Streptomyces sp. YIM 98790 TaxID=2689077 RepID=UPI00140AF34A|nr:ATP-binding protein [Streptomyces sp. YIM 98790]
MPEPQSHAASAGSGRPATGGSRPAPTGSTSRSGDRHHGRASARLAEGENEARRRVLRLAVVPSLLVSAVCTAVVTYLLRAHQGPGSYETPALWIVLGAALLLVCLIVAGAAYGATGESRAQAARYAALRRQAARGRGELHTLLQRVERGERIRPPEHAPPLPEPDGDAMEQLAREIACAHYAAQVAVAEAAHLVRGSVSGSDEKVEVFVNLARRLQSLVHRAIEYLDELENEVEDPDLLKGLFNVDHLATRIRRHAENLAVLGGAVARRQWTRPVGMTEVLRSAIAEVEQYSRVKLVPPVEGTLRGHAVADVIHLLAELVENATTYSAPQTQVLMRAQYVTAGLAVEVEDRGLGMSAAEQKRMNALLSGAERIEVDELLADGRIGLFVVASLAQRHNIVVQLQSNIYGGTQAVLVVPRELLGETPADRTGGRHPAGAVSAAPSASVPASVPGVPAPAADRPAAEARPLPQPRREAIEPAEHSRPDLTGSAVSGPPAAVDPVGRVSASPYGHAQSGAGHQPPHQAHHGHQPHQANQANHGAPPQGPQTPARAQERAHPAAQGPSTMPLGVIPPLDDGTADRRPELPRRRRQEHLAPQLRDEPQARPAAQDDREFGHDPGLMAAFRRGANLANDPEDR